VAIIGKTNILKIVESSDHGFYLDGEELGLILLPNAYVETTMELGKEVEVFIYSDSEDRLVATTETPLVQAGEFASLEVVNVHSRMGVFLDWGLQKDLLLPYREQGERDFRPGDHVVVAVYVDEYTNRFVASTRLGRYFSKDVPDYIPNEPVEVIVYSRSPLGYKAIVDKQYSGLIFHGETSDKLKHGDQFTGYVKKVHEDGKIDILRDPFGYKRVEPLAQAILDKLDAAGGRLPFNDKSSPQSIRDEFNISKQAFKQAIGTLYKQRLISINKAGIELV
jgi:predicted RNA-binding protein (virulence factor B family)